jgi:queuine tRNA-ribosyltransferase
MEEANRLYIEQSNLAGRLRSRPQAAGALVLWDVGLGAGANAMAAITCYEQEAARGPVRPLEIISFENDLDALRLAVGHPRDFPYLVHEAPKMMLDRGRWQPSRLAGLSWHLIEGDFVASMRDAPSPPELIYYDMFSSRSCGELWELETFERLFTKCAGRASELFTYTRSTANRASLLVAGFYVAKGPSAGIKEETTVALTAEALATQQDRPYELLDERWLQKWKRSAARIPSGIEGEEQVEFERKILCHPQFEMR